MTRIWMLFHQPALRAYYRPNVVVGLVNRKAVLKFSLTGQRGGCEHIIPTESNSATSRDKDNPDASSMVSLTRGGGDGGVPR